MTTPVIFRKDNKDGDVFALFPSIPADYQGTLCSCYQHVGQHSGASYQGCIGRSRPATPAEYADLLKELRNYGSADDRPYAGIVVVARRTNQHRQEFRQALRRSSI